MKCRKCGQDRPIWHVHEVALAVGPTVLLRSQLCTECLDGAMPPLAELLAAIPHGQTEVMEHRTVRADGTVIDHLAESEGRPA